ncbi:MAG: methyltransferase domain-containing protein, partial [Chloroflexota bacterium]
ATALEVRPRHKGRTTFRVIARKSGDHAFRRVDVQRAVERGLQSRFAAWRLVEDDAHLEIWVQLVGAWLVVTVRLSDAGMRHRHWRQTSLPASLKPTLAAAMCLLSHPQDGDVFLDPMCGSGTILIERAMLARYRLLLGGDADAQAVRATMDNIGRKHRPIEIRRWDARELPLESGSISVVVCNLPFGKQLGSATENRSLYPALIKEWRRVLAPTGRMVLLTSERALLRRAMEPEPTLAEERAIGVTVRGMKAWVIVQVSN